MPRLLAVLFVLSLLVRGATALTLPHAGYFDAFYYFDIARAMAAGEGMTESVIWNYLDAPTSLPRPANQYWMPLTNIVAWLGIAPLGRWLGTWRAAQVPFVLLSALIPPLAAWLAWRGFGRRDWALQAGLLTLFSGFYFTYWVTTDNFTPFALAVAVALLGCWWAEETGRTRGWAIAGIGAGLSHLARADGALLVLVVALLLALRLRRDRDGKRFLRDATMAALGYFVIMGPWFLRNALVTGTAFPGGGSQTIWMRGYDELFYYKPNLTPQRYLAWGLGPILSSKLSSLVTTALILMGAAQFFLAPFVIGMLRRAWGMALFRPFVAYALMLLLVMPLVFTFPATRGSVLHSTAALMPWAMALAPAGIARAVGWVAKRRRQWDPEQASAVLGMGATLVALIVTGYLYLSGVWWQPAPNAVVARWAERTTAYEQVGAWLREQGHPADTRLLAGDPPSVRVASGGFPVLAIPAEGRAALDAVAQDWDARWLILDRDAAGHPDFKALYEQSGAAPGWTVRATFEDGLGKPVYLFERDAGQ